MKIRTLILSSSKYFIESFGTYIMNCNDIGFDFQLFTDERAMENYLSIHTVDLILADERFWKDEFPKDCIAVSISSVTKLNTDKNYHEVNIYQRGLDILQDLQRIFVLANKNGIGEDKNYKIVSFYSPQGGTGKTVLAYICSMLCAKDNPSLYLNFEEFGSCEHLYTMDFEIGMEQIIYTIKDKRESGEIISNALKKDKRNVMVMPSVKNISDFIEITPEDIEIFIKKTAEVSGTEYLFIDMSGGLTQCNKKIMELSSIVFWVFSDDVIGNNKINRVREDKSLQKLPYYRDIYFLVNKCKTKNLDDSAIRIPFSESLSQGLDFETVLSGNKDFNQSCMEIISVIDRKVT